MSKKNVLTPTVVGMAATLLFGVVPCRAADWPMFGRDTTRNAVSPEKGAPLRWQLEMRDKGLPVQPARNVHWTAELGDINYAAPVVSGGLVWVGTNNDRPRNPKIEGDYSVLMCFRESGGKFLWQYVSPRLDEKEQDWECSGINCSPCVEGDRLWFTTNRVEVVCLDIGPLRANRGEPRLVWKLDMRKDLGVCPVWASCGVRYTCSIGTPYKDRIYVVTGNGVGNKTVTNPKPPSLLCLDKNTGKILWSDNSPGKNILSGQWSSPLIVEIKGRTQVIAAQGDGWVRSFDALTGKMIWRFDANSKTATWKDGRGTRNDHVATPVFYQGRIYVANGRSTPDAGCEAGRLHCIDPTKEGDISAELDDGPGKGKPNPNSGAVWCFARAGEKDEDQMSTTYSSVAVHNGLVVAPDLNGFVHCLDAQTGKKYWSHDLRTTTYASPLIVDGKIFIGADHRKVTVMALSKELKVLATNGMEDHVRSSPVYANGVLYIASQRMLHAIKSSDH